MRRGNRFPSLSSFLQSLFVLALIAVPNDGARALAQSDQPLPCQANASPEEPLSLNSCVRSSIGPEDLKTVDENVSYEEWRLRLEAGQTVEIDMIADEVDGSSPESAGQPQFDTFLELRSPGTMHVIATNDDRFDSLNSRIRHTATEEGEYIIRARPLFEGEGAYTLRVSAVAPPSGPLQLAAGRTEEVMTRNSQENEQWPGFRFHRYSFEGEEGERVLIRLLAPADRMQVMSLKDDEGQLLAHVMDRSDRLQFVSVLPRNDLYFLDVSIGGVEQPTPYVIEFERRTNAAATAPRRIRIGNAVTGEIGIDSVAAPDPRDQGRRVLTEVYQLPVRAGDVITVTVESDDFDTFLEAGTTSPLGFAAALTNDDSGATTNSLLVLRPEANGIVHLRVRPFASGSGGFRLTTRQGRTDAARAAEQDYTQLVFLQFAGSISRQDIIDVNNSLRAAGWRVQGSSGERLAAAAGLNEVRFSAEQDEAAAEALAAALTEANLGSSPVTPRRVGVIRPGTLEAWISN